MAKHSQRTGGKPRADARRNVPPGEDAGTLTDEEYLSAGGPDALDAATLSPETPGRDAHADSPPATPRGAVGEDPERAGAIDSD
ncbi:MAG TPA: hypothetical protein VHY19_06250 [Steroidobacteraceae bacterium]|jgi:hypothetical protein|nr:hypothetical protein [Steroidobacteraceae bacterium]